MVNEKRSIPTVPILVGAFVLIFGGGAYWFLEHRAPNDPPPPPVATAEAKAYVRNLQLSDVEMKAAENLAGQRLVEILGKITNHGDRGLKLVEVNCIFFDPWGQAVLRERVPIVGRRMGDLAPGQTKNFRLAFDTIPSSWNQATPQMVIAQIVFG